MHEYSLVEALVRRVEAEARKHGALAIHELSVRVGDLSGVDPELFRTAYETFRAGTICEKAPLVLSRVVATWSCPACAKPIPKGAILRCAACGEPARLDDGGDALTLDRIEQPVFRPVHIVRPGEYAISLVAVSEVQKFIELTHLGRRRAQLFQPDEQCSFSGKPG